MIENISYDEIINISQKLKESATVINQLLQDKNIPELKDFVSTVEGYSKFLETTVELYQDADKALAELAAEK